MKILKYYPVFWNISGKKCVVVGGGEVAQRKVTRLLDCGAKVSVVSPVLTQELILLKDKNIITHHAREYSAEDIAGAALVIGATDDDVINAAVSSDAIKKGIPVNIVDDPQKCDFILPSLVERGDLTIAIGTGGKSPALARYLRERLEETFGEDYAILAGVLGKLRDKMEKNSGQGKVWFDKLMDSGLLEAIRGRDKKLVKKIIREITGEEVEFEF